ncbi:MAG: CusA/CzcA family heavy metal efflux RND transporter [Verrucomicrobia bacterium]|nr:MAG: CusA/CzcA family heavy metal efflux RND transporter [Verrucomicrobiota bacterium]
MRHIIEWVIQSRLLVVVCVLGVMGAGYQSYRHLPVDAFPDVSPALVQVFVETDGLAPEEIEKFVTYPVESAMNGLPGLDRIRSTSNFGLSVVNVYFEEGTDIYFARQLVNERLQVARESIPEGFGEPVMGPITTGLGQILFYALEDETGKRTPEEMREIQDWIVKFNLQTVKGVTEVLSIGGQVKQFQVHIRPMDLLRYDLSLGAVKETIENNNSNTGAQFIVENDEEYIVRSVGLATEIRDLEKIVVKTVDGAPVFLGDLADIVIGGEIRRGLATMNGEGEAVVGMVLKLIGANTNEVIDAVKRELRAIELVLPAGVTINPYYDQGALVEAVVATVTNALIQGVGLVLLVLLLFMGGIRGSVVVALSIPFSVLFAFILMKQFGISANLMSLGGLAIAIGMMVDGAIVIVENVDRHLRERGSGASRREIVVDACSEVSRPIAFAISIIIIVFLPLFTLQGVEGTTFRPLAYSVALAMLGSLIYALLVAPVFATLFMRAPKKAGLDHGSGRENLVVRVLLIPYRPIVGFFVRVRSAAVALAILLLAVGAWISPRLGSEFVPRLNEGDLLIRATMSPSISLEMARDMMLVFERELIDRFPEVTETVTRVGRGEIGAHADPVNSAEIFVGLKPRSAWESADSLDELYAQMGRAFEDFPGAQFNFTQPIAAAVDELLTGTKAELAAKLFGDDLDVLEGLASEIETVLRGTPGATDVQKDQSSGTPQLRITIDRDAIARHGINVADVQAVIKTAVGGSKAGQIFEGARRFDIFVRFAAEDRATTGAIREILVDAPSGAKVPLDELVRFEEIIGARQITREFNQRFITIQCNVRGRDIGSFVAEAEERIRGEVALPAGYLLRWGGQFELQQAANKRLAVVVPITLALVFLLLYIGLKSAKNAFLIILNIPLALVGGVVALHLSGESLSVPASVGFIALFGIALENGLVLVTTLNQLVRGGEAIDRASVKAACLRLRPVLMTAATTALGLLPLLAATGTGSEVQRPLALVVTGGLISSTMLTLLVLPAIYKWFAVEPES